MHDTNSTSPTTVKAGLELPKWVDPPVHPINDCPVMSDEELRELAKDIDQNGLQEPIILWRDNREEAKGATGPFPVYLLDGRNRLTALKLLGIDNPFNARPGNLIVTTVRTLNAIKEVAFLGKKLVHKWEVDTDPETLHLSLNVFRRHLTPEKRREMIEKVLLKHPDISDRAIGRLAKVDHKTVSDIRSKKEGRGEIPHVETRTDTKGRKQPAHKPRTQLDKDAAKQVTKAIIEDTRGGGGEVQTTHAAAKQQPAEQSVPARSPVNERDTALQGFDAHILELVRQTKGAKPQRFLKTAVPTGDLYELALFLTELVALKKTAMPYGQDASRLIPAGNGVSAEQSADQMKAKHAALAHPATESAR